MAFLEFSRSKISGIVASVPKNEESVDSLTNLSDSEKNLLVKTVGINKRRVATKGMKASDLCFHAANELLDCLDWKKEEVELLVFVTQSPDYVIPTTSAHLQFRLGLSTSCLTLDINQGCAGYVYGLSTVNAFMSASGIKKALLLVGDTITQYIEKGDNSLKSIFADAGSCTAIERDESATSSFFNLQTDGSGFEVISVNKPENLEINNAKLKMNGHDVFNFGLKEVAKNVNDLLSKFSLSESKLDYLVLHQANKLLNEMIRKQLGFPTEVTPSTLEKFGNTSCATIPLTLVSELGELLMTEKKRLLLSGFGVGLTWGSAVLDVGHLKCCKLIEI